MFCEKCGTQNPDGARFCRSCGAPMPAAAPQPVQGGYAQQPVDDYTQQATGGYTQQPPMAPMTPVRALLRAIGTGPLFLTGAIAYTAALLFQLIGALQPGGGLAGTIITLMQFMPSDVRYELEDYGIDITETVGSMAAGSFISTLFSTLLMMLPAILIAVSIWLIFVAMRDTTGKPISTVGFTIIKVLTIIGIVFQVLGLIFVEIILGGFTYIMSQYSYDGSETPAFIILMVVVAIGFALAILYNVQLVRTLSAMTETSRTLVPSGKVSVYVAVICFIGSLFLLLGILFSGGIFGMLNVLGLIVAQISFGILLFSYRGKMKALSGGY